MKRKLIKWIFSWLINRCIRSWNNTWMRSNRQMRIIYFSPEMVIINHWPGKPCIRWSRNGQNLWKEITGLTPCEKLLDISRGQNTVFHLKCCARGKVTPLKRSPWDIWGLTIRRSRVFFWMRYKGKAGVWNEVGKTEPGCRLRYDADAGEGRCHSDVPVSCRIGWIGIDSDDFEDVDVNLL